MRRATYSWRRLGSEISSGNAWIANTWLPRARGLLGRPQLALDEAMYIYPCDYIHCFFMSYTIDVVFLDADGYAVSLYSRVRPWRLRLCWSGVSVVELLGGEIERLGLVRGDLFELSDQ